MQQNGSEFLIHCDKEKLISQAMQKANITLPNASLEENMRIWVALERIYEENTFNFNDRLKKVEDKFRKIVERLK